MKKKNLLIIIAALAVILLAVIIILAVKEKNKENAEEVNPTEIPTAPASTPIADEKTGPVSINDVKYPFTLKPQDDGSLLVEFASQPPEGYVWMPAESYIGDYIEVTQPDSRTYQIKGLMPSGTIIDLPLKTNDKYAYTSCIISLELFIGASNTYSEYDEIVQTVDDYTVKIPLLKANGNVSTGISVIGYSEVLSDTSASLDGVICNDVEEYADYRIEVSEKETRFSVFLTSTANDWELLTSGDKDVEVSELKKNDNGYEFSLKILEKTPEEENSEAGSAEEASEEKNISKREIFISLLSIKDNILLQINLEADESGTAEVVYHYAMIYDYGI